MPLNLGYNNEYLGLFWLTSCSNFLFLFSNWNASSTSTSSFFTTTLGETTWRLTGEVVFFAGEMVDLGGLVLRFGEVVLTLEEIVRRCAEGLVRVGEVLLTGGDEDFFS